MTDPLRNAVTDDRADHAVRDLLALAEREKVPAHTSEPLHRLVGRWRGSAARVAVVGEVSVGKSTLINALTRTRVLPAATEALSSVQVELVHGEALLATVYVRQGTEVAARQIAGLEEIEEYLTTRGDKAVSKRHGRDAEVLGARITVPSDLLARGLQFTDTPGVGGLDPAHRRATTAVLADTDAVLFVIGPDEPISESELRFLAESVDRVRDYLIVQTKADRTGDAAGRLEHNLAIVHSPRTWAKLLDDETRGHALAERFRKEVAGVSVSAQQALDAQPRPPGPSRDRDLELSGIAALEERLRTDVAERIGLIHRRTLLRLADSTRTAVAERLAGRRSLLGEGAERDRAVRERQESVHRWIARHGDVWKPDLDAAAEEAQREVRELGEERTARLEKEYRQKFVGKSPKAVEKICQGLVKEPMAASAEMQLTVKRRLDAAVEEITRKDPRGPVGAHLARLSSSRALDARVVTQGTLEDFLPDESQTGAALVTGAGTLPRSWWGARRQKDSQRPESAAHALAEAMPAAVLLATVAMALFGGITAWRRRRARTQEAAAELLASVLDAIRTEAVNDACAQAREQRDAITVEIEDRLRHEQAQIDQDREDLIRHTGLSAGERAGLLNGIDLAEQELAALEGEFEEVRQAWNP